MTLRRHRVQVDGRELTLLVRALDAHRYAVEIDGGDPREVTVLATHPTLVVRAGRRVLELGPVTGSGRYELGGGRVVEVTAHGSRAQRTGSPSGDPGRVTAPMPGRVVKVLVVEGQRVKAGAGLVVVEAMKMENEIAAPRDGSVAQVLVRAGDRVEREAPLVELGP